MYQHLVKRALDIVFSLLMMPLVALVVLVCGVFIKLEDGGSIFYNAPRVGKNGRPFTMYKLRSMKINAPDLVMEDGSTYNSSSDPRMTRIGAFMRKTSLDEFPQFVNVLQGTMSVIGPRPDLAREVQLYRGNEAQKLNVLPGITGYAAVYGRNALAWRERLKLDVYYVEHQSFALDVRIFLKTFTAIAAQEGIYAQSDQQPAGEQPAKVQGTKERGAAHEAASAHESAAAHEAACQQVPSQHATKNPTAAHSASQQATAREAASYQDCGNQTRSQQAASAQVEGATSTASRSPFSKR